jgi:hypothetical protein
VNKGSCGDHTRQACGAPRAPGGVRGGHLRIVAAHRPARPRPVLPARANAGRAAQVKLSRWRRRLGEVHYQALRLGRRPRPSPDSHGPQPRCGPSRGRDGRTSNSSPPVQHRLLSSISAGRGLVLVRGCRFGTAGVRAVGRQLAMIQVAGRVMDGRRGHPPWQNHPAQRSRTTSVVERPPPGTL